MSVDVSLGLSILALLVAGSVALGAWLGRRRPPPSERARRFLG